MIFARHAHPWPRTAGVGPAPCRASETALSHPFVRRGHHHLRDARRLARHPPIPHSQPQTKHAHKHKANGGARARSAVDDGASTAAHHPAPSTARKHKAARRPRGQPPTPSTTALFSYLPHLHTSAKSTHRNPARPDPARTVFAMHARTHARMPRGPAVCADKGLRGVRACCNL